MWAGLVKALPFLGSFSLEGLWSFLGKNYKWILGGLAAFFLFRYVRNMMGGFWKSAAKASAGQEASNLTLKVAKALGTWENLRWYQSRTEHRKTYDLLKEVDPALYKKMSRVYLTITEGGETLTEDLLEYLDDSYIEKLSHLI